VPHHVGVVLNEGEFDIHAVLVEAHLSGIEHSPALWLLTAWWRRRRLTACALARSSLFPKGPLSRAQAREYVFIPFLSSSLSSIREEHFRKVKSDFTLVKWVKRVSRKNSGTESVHEPAP
jgi:hypothetical protein